LYMKIKRIRSAEVLPQPQTLEEIDVPVLLHLTLNGDLFLIKDLNLGQNKIIIFATKTNLQCLSWAPYWIMDGTFKMVSTIFKQIYTIYAPVGTNDNFQLSNGNISCNQPLYPPELWSIYSSVESGFPHTQNKMQKEQQRVDCQVERILNGEQRPTPKKKAID
ncbi:17146_t:CDS:2, partial [Dentiscutata heterogama]